MHNIKHCTHLLALCSCATNLAADEDDNDDGDEVLARLTVLLLKAIMSVRPSVRLSITLVIHA